MSGQIKNNMFEPAIWIRLLYVILFVVIYAVGEVVITAIVVLQFGFVLITGERNDNLLRFGGAATQFMYDVLRYFTFNNDEKPFPFADWPQPVLEANQDVMTPAQASPEPQAGAESSKERTPVVETSASPSATESANVKPVVKKKTARRKKAPTRKATP